MTFLCAAFSFNEVCLHFASKRRPLSRQKNGSKSRPALSYMTTCLGYPHPDFKCSVFKSLSEMLIVCVSN